MKHIKGERKFRSANLLAVVSLFVLILAGGVVRSTGSGMGCPDWPKCFGKYIPPIKEAQLPANYRTEYAARQQKKNQHFAKVLDVFGYNYLAAKVRKYNPTSSVQEQFNAAKTWTEYINRLIGALTGLVLVLVAIWSSYYWKISKAIVFLSIFNLFLVGLQAWIGSIVVSTNLVPWIVTIHMLLALAILAISIYTLHLSKVLQTGQKIRTKAVIILLAFVTLLLDILQITIGTEVREKIDQYAARFGGSFRQDWIAGASQILYNHKNMALTVIIINIILYLFIRKHFIKSSLQQQLMSTSIIVIMLQVFIGVILAYWKLPPAAQVAHLVLASLLFGVQFYLLLNLFHSSEAVRVRYNVE